MGDSFISKLLIIIDSMIFNIIFVSLIDGKGLLRNDPNWPDLRLRSKQTNGGNKK